MIIDEIKIHGALKAAGKTSKSDVLRIIDKGRAKRGLDLAETAALACVNDPELIDEIFSIAGKIKDEIYGERLVLFAPLYISDWCANDCAYCSFQRQNRRTRRCLTITEIERETKCLVDMGHKRVLIESGEDSLHSSVDYICSAMETIYSVQSNYGNIRRININIASTTTADYKRLKASGIGTYQLFQETYHRKTYEEVHKGGPKAGYDRQITAHARAFEGGIDDLGIGVLFGLYDWRFEVASLISHAKWMEDNLGVGPHTISVPRFCPAPSINYEPRYPVSDDDFLKIIAILRIAVPYTGLILSTREEPAIRQRAFALGISQASAGSVTRAGGYSLPANSEHLSQFKTHDTRRLDEVVNSIAADGLIPSFCTACYRSGRTGESFMELAKPGGINKLCRPNALFTFAEYIEDYGGGESRKIYDTLIARTLQKINDPAMRDETAARLEEIRLGKRDVFF